MRTNSGPAPDFISGLEKQLTSELRRRQRFAPVEKSPGLKRFMKTTILFVMCAATGVAAAKTVEHIESSKRRILHVARVEAEIEQIEARQRVVQGMADELKVRVEAGLIREDELADVAVQSRLLELDLERAVLNLEEVHMSGEAPSNELYAPLQGGRDFVTERLRIEYRQAEARKELLEYRLVGFEKMVEAGLVDRRETADVDSQLERICVELEDIQRRIDLRRDYLSGDLSARQVSVRQMIQGARSRLTAAENIQRVAAAQFEEMSEANVKGLISMHEVRQAEYQMISARAEYRIAEIELELLEKELEE